GRKADGTVMVPTSQMLRPVGRQVEFNGRPTDATLLAGDRLLAVANQSNVLIIDTQTGEVVATQGTPGGHSVHGIVATADGRTVFTTNTSHTVGVWQLDAAGAITAGEPLAVPGDGPGPAGLALSADEQTLYVATTRANRVWALPVAGGEGTSVEVGAVPYALQRVGDKLYVSNWGGRHATEDDARTASTSGTSIVVDERHLPNNGTVTVVDLPTLSVTSEIRVGLLPSGLAVNADGSRLYVANANSDSISIIDTARDRVVGTIEVKPEATLPFGSGLNDVAVSPDGTMLYAACGANNAVAAVRLRGDRGQVLGWAPVGWYPGGLALSADGQQLAVINTKGVGTLSRDERHTSYDARGSVSLLDLAAADWPGWTARTLENNRAAIAAAGVEPPRRNIAPVPLPERHGEPSLIKHVVYIIRENKTYDQVLGDLDFGRRDPSLVIFGEEFTPNTHKLAREFQLLDNFYCNGVLSADGHSWVTQGYVTSYMEKSFGGWIRSYPDEGQDVLAYSPGGFIWDNVLGHGLTFRAYGELCKPVVRSKVEGKAASWTNIYQDFIDDGVVQDFELSAVVDIPRLRDNLCPTVPGFAWEVPDVYRASEFIREMREAEATGDWPNLLMILLPEDHTVGTSPGFPTPGAMVADNDLAVGRIVEAVTNSKFWPETAIFIAQDDPQSGADHVDGHRSPAHVISPYTPRGGVNSTLYSQTGLMKTIELLLGLPPMNQLDLLAEPMRACFEGPLDLTPFTSVPNNIPLDTMNPPRSALSGRALYFAELSESLDWSDGDLADNDALNRIIWHAQRGDDPYPQWLVDRDRLRYGLR
ncbi:MAG TPA: hypothetical protein DCZ72_06435, partial [Armatimonadetes bacterium]|nr:hypothetical protein [Armatimonadota bacterium]